MLNIITIKDNECMSTQDLLLTIEVAVKAGVTNTGQRVGSMCLPNTEIIVERSTSADVGWLNTGGLITVKGDAGNTERHCSNGWKIYIGSQAVDCENFSSVLGERVCVGMVGGGAYCAAKFPIISKTSSALNLMTTTFHFSRAE